MSEEHNLNWVISVGDEDVSGTNVGELRTVLEDGIKSCDREALHVSLHSKPGFAIVFPTSALKLASQAGLGFELHIYVDSRRESARSGLCLSGEGTGAILRYPSRHPRNLYLGVRTLIRYSATSLTLGSWSDCGQAGYSLTADTVALLAPAERVRLRAQNRPFR